MKLPPLFQLVRFVLVWFWGWRFSGFCFAVVWFVVFVFGCLVLTFPATFTPSIFSQK